MRKAFVTLVVAAAALVACGTQPVAAPSGAPPPAKKQAPAKPAPEAALPQPLWGTVTQVPSAVSAQVRDAGGRQFTVMLAGLAAPGAPAYDQRAQRYLSHLLLNQMVQVRWFERRGNQLVAQLLINGRDVNLEQVAAGYARVDADALAAFIAGDAKRYQRAEADARRGRFGLWSEDAGAK